MPEQVIINSIEFARNGESLSGCVAIANLSRLEDLLSSNSGTLEYSIVGKKDESGKPYLICSAKGVLQLNCQRCLGALDYPINISSQLELVDEEPALTMLIHEDELADAIKVDSHLDVLALVEDEILLSLPMAPAHELGVCKAGGNFGQAVTDKQNVFSALAALKTKDLRKN